MTVTKTKKLKLELDPETIRDLTIRELACVAGGRVPSANTGCKTCG
jgi:hypothetical protein